MGHYTDVLFWPGEERFSYRDHPDEIHSKAAELLKKVCSVSWDPEIDEDTRLYRTCFKGYFGADKIERFQNIAWPQSQIFFRGEEDDHWTVVNAEKFKCRCHHESDGQILGFVTIAERERDEARQEAETARRNYNHLKAEWQMEMNRKMKEFIDKWVTEAKLDRQTAPQDSNKSDDPNIPGSTP